MTRVLACVLLLAATETQVPRAEIAVSARANVGHSLSLRVCAPGGPAISGAIISLVPGRDEYWNSPSCVCTTGGDGVATFTGVPDARFFHAFVNPTDSYFSGYYIVLPRADDSNEAILYPSNLHAFRSYCNLGEPPGLRPLSELSLPIASTKCSFVETESKRESSLPRRCSLPA